MENYYRLKGVLLDEATKWEYGKVFGFLKVNQIYQTDKTDIECRIGCNCGRVPNVVGEIYMSYSVPYKPNKDWDKKTIDYYHRSMCEQCLNRDYPNLIITERIMSRGW